MIPAIIHQTWKNKQISKQFQEYTQSWRSNHPYMEYRFWDDHDNREFIKNKYPWFLPLYDNYTFGIQKSDVVRYFILYTYGGLYIDLDFECFKPIDNLLDGRSCVFATEASEHCASHGVNQIISNAFMACVPNHPFMYAVIKSLITFTSQEKKFDRFILETTGPFMLNRVYDTYVNKNEITLIAPELLAPLTYEEAEKIIEGEETSKSIQNKLKEAYAVHYYVGSWWKNDGVA